MCCFYGGRGANPATNPLVVALTHLQEDHRLSSSVDAVTLNIVHPPFGGICAHQGSHYPPQVLIRSKPLALPEVARLGNRRLAFGACYFTHSWDPIRCYLSGSERTWEQ